MLHLFLKGGPIMWPLLITSLIALSVIFERAVSVWRDGRRRCPADLRSMMQGLSERNINDAIEVGEASRDIAARCLAAGLQGPEGSFATAFQHRAAQELERLSRGLPALDTIITIAPLLGLLGTVTGLIHAFGLMGASELEAPAAITGGIAEALIATAFGLGIAIISLIPFNWLNTRIEKARVHLQNVGSEAELSLWAHRNDNVRVVSPTLSTRHQDAFASRS